MGKKRDHENCNKGVCEDSDKFQKLEHLNPLEPLELGNMNPFLCEDTGRSFFKDLIMMSAANSYFKSMYICIQTLKDVDVYEPGRANISKKIF